MKIVKSAREPDDKIAAGDGELRVTAIHGIAGERGGVAEIFAAAQAITAGPVGAAEPGDAHARAEWKIGRGSSCNFADNLMARDQGLTDWRQFAFDNVQIGPAYTASPDFDQDLTGRRFRLGYLSDLQRVLRDARG